MQNAERKIEDRETEGWRKRVAGGGVRTSEICAICVICG